MTTVFDFSTKVIAIVATMLLVLLIIAAQGVPSIRLFLKASASTMCRAESELNPRMSCWVLNHQSGLLST